MDFDYSAFIPEPNEWFQTRIEIEGEGRADFLSPKGFVVGPVKAWVDEIGQYSIELEVENIEAEEELPLGLQQLISVDDPEIINGEISLSYPPSNFNTCTKLEITSDEGNLIAINFDNYQWQFRGDKEIGFKDKLSFQPTNFEFLTKNYNPPSYWVIPLVNFISGFMQTEPSLANHPLRIFPSKEVPSDIPDDKKPFAESIANQKNRLIVFKYNEDFAFIEKLPEYEQRVDKLNNRETPSIVTSIMVGSLGDYPIEKDKLGDWFPFVFIDLLGFATGIEVSFPWIELRDSQGKLVKRIHSRWGKTLYMQGSKPIDEVLNGGTGHLLEMALNCADINESYLRSAIKLAIRGGRYGQSIEDKMDYLCRALDTFCERFNLSKQDLLSLSNETTKNEIHSILKQSGEKLEEIIKDVESSEDYRQSGYLKTIAGRLSNVAHQDRKFGLALVDLLELFGLLDGIILDKYFLVNPRKDGTKKWSDLVSMYRGRVIHAGYFDIRGGKHQVDDVLTVIEHLHDILARIILKILGYEGTYNPTTLPFAANEEVDWVKSSTPVGMLGYSKYPLKFKMMTISRELPSEEVSLD